MQAHPEILAYCYFITFILRHFYTKALQHVGILHNSCELSWHHQFSADESLQLHSGEELFSLFVSPSFVLAFLSCLTSVSENQRRWSQ